MKNVLQGIIISWFLTGTCGQAAPTQAGGWTKGRVELTSGAIVEGELCYNWKVEILQLRLPNGQLKAYSARQITRFLYFDTDHDRLRTFTAVDFPVNPTRERRLILEEYAVGPMIVYRRLRYPNKPARTVDSRPSGANTPVYDNLDEFLYYVCSDDAITELAYFERDLWPQMQREFGPQLHYYRQNQHLDITSTLARVLLISHYNDLKSVSLAASAPPEFLLGTPR